MPAKKNVLTELLLLRSRRNRRKSLAYPDLPVRWQSCPDEDSLEKWGQGRLLVVRGRPRTTPWSIALGSPIVRSNAVVGHR